MTWGAGEQKEEKSKLMKEYSKQNKQADKKFGGDMSLNTKKKEDFGDSNFSNNFLYPLPPAPPLPQRCSTYFAT